MNSLTYYEKCSKVLSLYRFLQHVFPMNYVYVSISVINWPVSKILMPNTKSNVLTVER